MTIWDKKSEQFVYEYLNNFSPTGFEISGQKIWLKYLSSFVDETHVDAYGTAYGTINPGQKFSVVIEAHADEISWFVNYISEDGYINVIRNGGSDHMIAPSKRVMIHTKDGFVHGVFGWPAIHLRNGEDSKLTPSTKNIFIDIGVKSKKEVLDLGIHVGCVVTFMDELMQMGDYYVGRGLDNRMGGFAIAQVARLLHKNKIKLPFTLYIVNSVQEEVGLRGASMIAHRLRPNIAIVTDVTHDTTTPLIKTKEEGEIKCGLGPVITYAPAIHYRVLQEIIAAAEENDIAIQRSASSRVTGTDTDAFAYSREGIPSTLLSLPLKYMHTTVEMAHKEDISNLSQLIYHTLRRLQPDMSLSYL